MIRALLTRDAQVCLVAIPVSPGDRNAALRDPAFAEARGWYWSLADALGVQFVAYFELLNDSSILHDYDHLNEAAVEAYSSRLLADFLD